ncbi:MAG: cytochrome c [Magnetococcales bacterium]|nr:cytochrome c [Magnetococcales bacterium]
MRSHQGKNQPPSNQSPVVVTPPAQLPAEHEAGAGIFQKNCLQCHGLWAEGTDQGPPLIHAYYKPTHHADFSFYRAVESGVRAHHWSFGDMPPVPDVTREMMEQVVPFLRWWQQQNGIS